MSTITAPQDPDERIGSQPTAREADGRSTWPRFLLALVAGVLLALVAGAGALYAFDQQYANQIRPGVHVGGVDLQGLDREAARARLTDAFASVRDGQIVVTVAGQTHAIAYDALGRRLDVEGMLDEAFAIGRTGNLLARSVDAVQVALQGNDVPARMSLDGSALESRLAAMAASTDTAPKNATATSTASGFVVQPSAAGRALDQAASIRLIADRLADPAAPGLVSVVLPDVPVAPDITDAEAADAVMAGQRIVANDLVLTVGSDTWTIPSATLRTWLRFAASGDGVLVPAADPKVMQKAIATLAKKINRAPTESTFLIGKNGQIVGATKSKDGRSVDVAGTVAAVGAALAARAPSSFALPVSLVVSVTPPKLSSAQAETVAPLMTKISTWTTHYVPSDHNGFGANITIPARIINGTLVAPGGTFDFWNAVGDVTRAKGYLNGGAIIDGHTDPTGALGGGICSASTTLFNAAARAGLALLARTNHYYYINRYPVGLDATVFISASGAKTTMAFRNDTKYPILIRGFASPGIVTFDLYGVPNGRTVTFSTPVIKNPEKAIDTTQQSDAIPVGTTKRVEYPTDGFDVWVTRTVTDANGTIVHRETFYSHYARIDGILQIGVPPKASPTPSPTPSPSPTPKPSPSPTPTH